ncbi:MAG TPA: alpha/beta fold hydrolase [Acidimicrobiia bacterium]|nr:alpha/beta fold hydrolase [Acidimicrobiia bacterium]
MPAQLRMTRNAFTKGAAALVSVPFTPAYIAQTRHFRRGATRRGARTGVGLTEGKNFLDLNCTSRCTVVGKTAAYTGCGCEREGASLVMDTQEVNRRRCEPVAFTSGGDRLVGLLYLPAGQPVAAVVTTGPLTSVKEQATGAYARALSERGFAALAFDHRTFGQSEGEPRQFESPEGKAADVRAAVTALAADERTRDLPVVAVGICAGAGYMARAVADDPRILGFAGVAGYYSNAAAFAESSPDTYQAAIARGRAAERRWRESGEVETIPAVAADGGDVAMPLREAYEFYGTSRGAVDNYTNGFAVQSLAYTTPFDAQEAAARIRVPFLLVHSEHALAPTLARQFYDAVSTPKSQLWLESEGQIDFYDDPRLIGLAADAIAEHVKMLKR